MEDRVGGGRSRVKGDLIQARNRPRESVTAYYISESYYHCFIRGMNPRYFVGIIKLKVNKEFLMDDPKLSGKKLHYKPLLLDSIHEKLFRTQY